MDLWGSDCSNPGCYGVPLYRQYLTGNGNKAAATREWKRWYDNRCDQDRTTPACRWPFIRMSGSDTSQRQTMTINNGLYYLDTTVSGDIQKTEPFTTNPGRSLNVFKAGQAYYMFFVYAKQSTVQTYQIYVGRTFNKATQFQPVRVNIETKDLRFTPVAGATRWVQTDYAASQGILVTAPSDSPVRRRSSPRRPMVSANRGCSVHRQGNSCVSALKDGNPFLVANPKLKAESDAVCKAWAVKDLDCPPAGCFGFSFTLPPDFATGAYNRPVPQPFPTGPDTQQETGQAGLGTKS